MKLERVNLFFGLSLFIIFLITGYYMKEYFKPNHYEDILMRLQIRSNHIYVLFVSLLNILSFKTVLKNTDTLSRIFDFSIRVLLISSGIMSLFAFVNEHDGQISNRILTLITVVLSLTSIGLFLVNELINLVRKKSI